MNLRHAQARYAALALAFTLGALGCSLGNIQREDCTSNEQCAQAFGPGSTCVQGLCTQSPNAGCLKKDATGRLCSTCPPQKPGDFAAACTDAMCTSFDNKRLTHLGKDGGLPGLPP